MVRVILVLMVTAVAVALPMEPKGYHELVGIKLAERIRQAEQAIDFDGARIVGGSPAALGDYPYLGGLVVVLSSGAISVCGSSLLTNTRALTAAHCWFDGWSQAQEFTVVLGSTTIYSGGTRIPTRDVVMHPNYSVFTWANDIAVVRLSGVSYTSVIQPITLPTGWLENESFAGVWAQVAGFGRISDVSTTLNQVLNHVSVRVISNEECLRTYPNNVWNSTVCSSGVGRVGPCSSDSGGPLSTVFNGQRLLIGVVSFVASTGCESESPAAYARVSYYVPWIQSLL